MGLQKAAEPSRAGRRPSFCDSHPLLGDIHYDHGSLSDRSSRDTIRSIDDPISAPTASLDAKIMRHPKFDAFLTGC